MVITDLNTVIHTNVPHLETLKGYQIDGNHFVSFGKLKNQMFYAYRLFTFDAQIVDGTVECKNVYEMAVDENGFDVGGEHYSIEVVNNGQCG